MIPLDRVFSLFEKELDKPTLVDYTKTPLYQITMFKKYLLNINFLNKKIIENLKVVGEEVNENQLKQANQTFIFNRAWDLISNINVKNENCRDILIILDSIELSTALNIALNYFESTEEYEKCAHLKSILDFLTSSP